MVSVFSPNYKVPVKLIAETPALRKKTNSVRGIAGPRRKQVMMEIRRQKAKTTRKLAYMDLPEPRRAAEPEPTVAAKPQPSAKFVIPTAKDLPPSDDEVLIDILSPLPFLTVARARLLLRQLLVRAS